MQTITITYNQALSPSRIAAFKSHITRFEKEPIFHNHDKDQNTMYQVPLVHYRSHNNQATLFGINEGAKAIENSLKNKELIQSLNGIAFIEPLVQHNLKILPDEQTIIYKIHKYIPFDAVKYLTYKTQHTIQEKIIFLEDQIKIHLQNIPVLYNEPVNNIDQLFLQIIDINAINSVKVHQNNMLAFDMEIASNFLLPDKMALGKHTRMGFGWICDYTDNFHRKITSTKFNLALKSKRISIL
jgi:hypothetical protein